MKLFRSRASVLIALSAVLIAAAAGIKIYKSAAPRVPFALRPSPVPVYHSPALSLERIALKVFYAVPQDRAAQIYPGAVYLKTTRVFLGYEKHKQGHPRGFTTHQGGDGKSCKKNGSVREAGP